MPAHFLARLPLLEWLDVRGGSGVSADFVRGCARLRFLVINQVRGLSDISAVADVRTLELISLYGLPQVRTIPSFAALLNLRRAEVGSMKGLAGLTGLLDAPALAQLVLGKRVGLAPDDPSRIATHPSIKYFYWFAEDVPESLWVPVVERIGKPRGEIMGAREWAAARMQ